MERPNPNPKTTKFDLLDTSRKLRDRNEILDLIREMVPVSFPELRRKLNISQSNLWAIVDKFEFAGLLETRVILNEDNRAVKIISLPDSVPVRIDKEEGNGKG